MGTDEAKAIYKERAATAECVNALARERGLLRLRIRGTAKVRCVLLMYALAHNLMRTLALAPELLGYGAGARSGTAMSTYPIDMEKILSQIRKSLPSAPQFPVQDPPGRLGMDSTFASPRPAENRFVHDL